MRISRKGILVGFILYVIPIVINFLSFRFFSWLIKPYNSIHNAIIAYAVFIGLITLSFIGGFIVAAIGFERTWWVKFFFAIQATVLSLPILPLALIGLAIIGIQKWFGNISGEKTKARIKNSMFACTITSMLSAMVMFANFLFVVEAGNVRTARNIRQAVFVINHLSSGDYFLAAVLALFRNWRIMIGTNLWKNPFLSWFFDLVGVPINREEGAEKKRAEAISISKTFLSSNKKGIIGVFSQSTRERVPEEGIRGMKIGAFKIACDLGLKIVPVVLLNTNKWRRPGEQDKSNNKDKKSNFLNKFLSFAKQYYMTGINPTFAKVIYCKPISSKGKTPSELLDETQLLMDKVYRYHMFEKKRIKKEKRKNRKIRKKARA